MARYLNTVAAGGRNGSILSGLGRGLAQAASPVAFGASALQTVTGQSKVGSIIAGSVVGLGTAAFYYGLSREAKSLLVKIPGYTMAGLSAVSVLFLILAGAGIFKSAAPEELPERGEV